MLQKIIGIAVLFVGEALTIYAEVLGAKMFYFENKPFWFVTSRIISVVFIGSSCLLAGYMFGLQAFKNIWIVTVISITSILVAEPIINYTITHQLPTKSAFVGLILGFIGLVITLVWD